EKGQMGSEAGLDLYIVASFIVMSLFDSLPHIYLSPFVPGIDGGSLFVNNLFESASGFTTTGVSMITELRICHRALIFTGPIRRRVGGLSFVYVVMILFFPQEKLRTWKGMIGSCMIRLREFIVALVEICTVSRLSRACQLSCLQSAPASRQVFFSSLRN
ncbi:MAG TPA: hypothetical protein VNI77_06760, partial [Nitrososphaera sp.]|nr:hypothetical protein [Nitrososphaera sp.]